MHSTTCVHTHTVLIKNAYHSLAFPRTLPYSCADAARNVSEAAQSCIHTNVQKRT